MTASSTASVTDFSQFAGLRAGAKARSPDALKAAARQFESLFTQQLLKASHATAFGDDLMGGPESDTYRDLFDQQMALHLSSGRGLGIADLLIRQLQGLAQPSDPATDAAGAIESAARAPIRPADGSADTFVDSIQPAAEKAAAELGVPAEVLMAQAALETGWGKHPITTADGGASHNYFGIKADAGWTGARVTRTTTEVRNGVAVKETAAFRAYGSVAEGFEDYVRFIKDNPRYAAALRHGGDGTAYARGLQQAGYATDPAYARKIARIAYGRTMQVSLNPPAAAMAARSA